jgi:hypothetical protein
VGSSDSSSFFFFFFWISTQISVRNCCDPPQGHFLKNVFSTSTEQLRLRTQTVCNLNFSTQFAISNRNLNLSLSLSLSLSLWSCDQKEVVGRFGWPAAELGGLISSSSSQRLE